MILPIKLLEQIAFNTRPKTEQHMLIVMDKSIHEEYLTQPLQTNKKQFKIAVTFLSAYNGFFKVTNSNNNFFSRKHLSMRISFKLESPKELMRSSGWILKLKGLILRKNITKKLVIRFISNPILEL